MPELDLSKWLINTGGHGFGNAEQQYYSKQLENIRIVNKQLVIEAHKEAYLDMNYTSAKISSKGLFSFQYGRVDVRCKIPKGQGTWPAVWMLPDCFNKGTSWPECGEIDIMENVGQHEDVIHFSLHSKKYNHNLKNQDTHFDTFKGISERFAVYSMVWEHDYIEFLVDDVSHAKFDRKGMGDKILWPFDQNYYLILNLAIGGYWGGAIDDAIFPVQFLIDYIRVYKKQ
jgi:beta-glucanase (GH16 family)